MLKEQFLQLIRSLKEMEFSKSPNFLTMEALHGRLMAKGFSERDASRIVASMEIRVSQSFVDDKDLFEETIEIYADSIVDCEAACSAVSDSLFWEVVKNQKQGISLRYED